MDAPGPDINHDDYHPEWWWANVVLAWSRDTTNPGRLCNRNRISLRELHTELRRRGIDPYAKNLPDWVAVPDRLH